MRGYRQLHSKWFSLNAVFFAVLTQTLCFSVETSDSHFFVTCYVLQLEEGT